MSQHSWERVIGLGVAGNFAGHLEQAGEANDFKDLEIEDVRAPKGVFPFYVPPCKEQNGDTSHFLHCYPISNSHIRLGSDDENHQIEPEVALLCDLVYHGQRVAQLTPVKAMAHNDCSIRREGATKISQKKNWGKASKGTASQSIPIDRFDSGGHLNQYRIASYLLRDGEINAYGVDSSVASYSYIYTELTDWLISQLNDQIDNGPLENISDWLEAADYPSQALISIGATRYTDFGETTFLARGDRSFVVLYDGTRYDDAAIRQLVENDEETELEGISFLRQEVV